MNDVHKVTARKLRAFATAIRAERYAPHEFGVREAMEAEAAALDKRADELDPPRSAIEEPTEPKEYGSVILARIDEWDERCRWSKPTSQPGWYSEHGAFVGGFQMLRDVEVLRVGVAERADVAPEDYHCGANDTKVEVGRWLRMLRAEAITAERKDAYDKALKAVEAMR